MRSAPRSQARSAFRTVHVRALVLVLLAVSAMNPTTAAADDDLAVFEGPQVGCVPGARCIDVHVELDRTTGAFLVRKGFAVPCRGFGTPQPAEIRLSARCENLNLGTVGGVVMRQQQDGDVTLRMWKKVPSRPEYLASVLAILSPVPRN